MSLADLAKKAAEHKGKGGQKAKDGAKPDRKPGITKENYQFDYSVNVKNIETFTLAKRFLTNDIGETYGEHSTIIESGAHFMMFAPDTPQPAELEDPVNGEIVRMQYKTEYANYIRKKADYDAKCIQLWHFIYAKCTIAMKNALKQYNNWTVINNTKDALALWLAIVDISVNGTDTAEPSAKRVMEALHRFDRLHQKTTESVAEFYDRFNENYDAMVAQGAKLYNVTIPEGIDPEAEAEARVEANEREELMKAMGFLNKLDRTRFKGMIDDLVNSSHRGRDEYPKTLIAAFIMASNYKENGLRVDGVMHAKEIHGVGFVTKPSARSPAHERSVPSRPTDNKRACYICGDTNHFQRNCPMKEKVVKYLAKASKEEKDEVKKTIGLVTLSSLHEEYAFMEKGNVTFDNLDLGC